MFAPVRILQMIGETSMQTINMTAWNHKVSHNCLHALLGSGYRKPRDIAFVRVSRLLRIPEVDANDVASMLFAALILQGKNWRSVFGSSVRNTAWTASRKSFSP